MASCRAGHVYIIETYLSTPPKAKFCLCIAPEEGLFVWINSKEASHGKDQLPLPAGCHELVDHASFLDLSRLLRHPPLEMDTAREFAMISRQLRDDIIAAVGTGLDMLAPRRAQLVVDTLRRLYP